MTSLVRRHHTLTEPDHLTAWPCPCLSSIVVMTKSKKRKNGPVDGDSGYTKRARPSLPEQDDEHKTGLAHDSGRIDPSTGLRTAFPGLDDADDGELFYGPAGDGMEYLRMVR